MNDTDEILCTRLRSGDLAAFDALYARYEAPLYRFIRSYVDDTQEAEDLFHEAFVKVLDERPAELTNFRGWIYRTARNLSLNRLRSRRRGAAAEKRLGLESEPLATAPDDDLAQKRAARALDAAVGRLPQALTELFHLRAGGMSYEEIATVLEVPLGTVKSRMHELIGQLRKELRAWNAL